MLSKTNHSGFVVIQKKIRKKKKKDRESMVKLSGLQLQIDSSPDRTIRVRSLAEDIAL